MSKKTNSLLFRIGITSLWRNKFSNHNQVFNNLRFEKIIFNELIKKKWNILSIKWNVYNINIQLYTNFIVTNFLKKKIFKYFKNYKNIKKLSEKFSLNFIKLNLILLKIKQFYFKLKKKKLIKNLILIVVFFKKFKLNLIISCILFVNFFNWLKINYILNLILKYKILNKSCNDYYYQNNKIIKSKLQKINSFLYFRMLSIYFENILFYLSKKKRKIFFNNIWHNQGWYFKYFIKNKFISQLLFLSIIYNNVQIFVEFLSIMLKKDKNHRKYLRKIVLIIEIFWKKQKIKLQGIQLRISGKLNGKMRKSKYHYSIGKVQLQSFNTFLNYGISYSYTKFGILSIKFWILHGNKQI